MSADKGSMFVDDINGVIRKITPNLNNQVPISDISLPNGVYWGRLTQAQIGCNEINALATPIGVLTNDYNPPFYTSLTTTIITTGGVPNATLTGILPKGQCYLILINAGALSFTLLDNNAGSINLNRFSLDQPTLEIKPKQSVYLYYSNQLLRWVVVGSAVANGVALYLNDLVDVQTGTGIGGDTTGDRLTYVKNASQVGGYPFIISPVNWINLTVITGAITFDNTSVPLVVPIAGNNIATLIPFVGVLQPGSFLVTTNGLGRLINSDQFTWNFNINFSCSITGSANSEWDIDLRINGAVASNSLYTTIVTVNRYISATGFWTATLKGSSASGAPFNQYCEIYVTRRNGTGNATFGSCYLSITGCKLMDRP